MVTSHRIHSNNSVNSLAKQKTAFFVDQRRLNMLKKSRNIRNSDFYIPDNVSKINEFL